MESKTGSACALYTCDRGIRVPNWAHLQSDFKDTL